jgi:membrane protease YdiL (CAAX protease family)
MVAAPPVGFVARHPLAAFFGWFFTVGQAFAFAPVVFETGVPHQVFIVGSSMFGLLLPALVITRITEGPDGVRVWAQSLVNWRVSIGWYAFALLAVSAVSVAGTVLLLGPPAQFAVADLGSLFLSGFVLQLVFTMVPNNWAEEAVWSGFVQARMQRRHRPAVAAVLVAPLFAMQHISLMWGNSLLVGALLMVGFTVVMIPYRFLTGWAFNRTGSLFLLGLIHAAGNAIAPGSGFGDGGVLRRLYPDNEFAGMVHLLAFAVIGLVVLLATRGRLGGRRTEPKA